ncbi:hypothetical protein NLU13_8884 [Sarocladium strictum]|uniref:WSC domain-containing protein n=1 Tax=Sarocladium strictum TaxID=5046 RepID=A0AA39L3N7_SARSR|nr:hypothetical protein NLU13_8884 [Sarocladium strictum]
MKLLATLLAFAGLANGLADTDTITWGGDNSRTGYQTNHNMDPAIVGSAQFGQIFRTQLPGRYGGAAEEMFSQPLVYTPSGDDKQYVYISTTQNNVYKLNARTGEILASRNLHIPFLTADLDGCVDINPNIGITSTGVIDPDTDTLYLTSKTYRDQSRLNVAQGRDEARIFVHALDANDLSERPNFPVDLEGIPARNNPARLFGGGIHLQRPALLHTGQYIYAGFASHCVHHNFTGWIMGWDKTTGETVEHFSMHGEGVPSPLKGGGIWMSGGGLASDDAGSIFFASGNGNSSQLANVPVAGFNPPAALEQAAVHMTQNEDGSLDVVDFFMPWEKQALDGADQDLGTSPLEILPSEFSCGEYKRIGVVTGKSGKTYWLNLDNLGGYRNGPDGLDDVIQVYQNENSVYAGAGVYPLEGGYIYINVIQFPSHVFKFSCNNGRPAFTKVADTPVNNAYILGVSHGTVTSLNGQPGTGMLWITDVQGSHLRIYDAVPRDGEMVLLNSFSVPGSMKFGRPVFGDGMMYQCSNQGYVYGFGAPINQPLNCSGTVDFGTVDIAVTSATRTITCEALINLEITSMGLAEDKNFILSGNPMLPLQLAAGKTVTFEAAFKPSTVGFLTTDVAFNTTNNAQGFASRSSTRLTGTGSSADALLFVSPNSVFFQGVITGQDPNSAVENIQVTNRGNSLLTVNEVQYSTESANGPFKSFSGSGDLVVGKFRISDIPAEVEANTGATLTVRFDSSESGDFSAFLKFVTNGGTKAVTIAGSSGPGPKALVEFQTTDGEGWVEYEEGKPFTFGNVTENTSRSLRMRVSNVAPKGAVRLYLTVSKPPAGGSSIIRAANSIDLGEGTSLGPGENATAVITCTSAKRQWNTDPRNGTATWTMNTNDATFEKHVIDFFCNSVAEQAPPLLPGGQGQYRYIGCFKENTPGRQLQSQLYGNDNNTNPLCIETCATRGLTFCGTQYTRECWGGNKIPAVKVDDINCNFACRGDIHQVCGGNGENEGAGGSYISLFADSLTFDGNYTRPDDGQTGGGGGGTAPKPVANAGVLGYKHIGCHTEATTGRALQQQVTLQTPTVENCVEACLGRSYPFAGVEYAGECFCGSALRAGANPAPAAECNMACKGNTTELCGGGSRLNVYQLDDGSIPTTAPGTSISTTSTPGGSTSTSSTPGGSTSTSSTPGASTSISSTPSTGPSTTTSSSTGAPVPTTPSRTSRVGDYKLQGCWTEGTNVRALSGKTYARDDMTLNSCATFCAGFTYFGTEYGRECWCGNTLGNGSVKATNQLDCSFKCAGNPLQYCGAGNRLELYMLETASTTSVSSSSSSSSSSIASSSASQSSSVPSSSSTPRVSTSTTEIKTETTTSTSSVTERSVSSSTRTSTSASVSPTAPIIDPGNGNFTFYSCAVEPSSGRLLTRQIYNDGDDMTIQSCLERCWNYKWVGVEYGRECWCNNEVNWKGNTGATAGRNATDNKECNFRCPGDSMVWCGGSSRMSLYTRKEDEDEAWE